MLLGEVINKFSNKSFMIIKKQKINLRKSLILQIIISTFLEINTLQL